MGCKSPQIYGVEDITVYQGADVDLMDGVYALDSNMEEIEVSVSPSELDMCEVGEHDVVYSASGEDDSQMNVSICVEPRLYAPNRCNFVTVHKNSKVTILQAPPPTINGVGNVEIGDGDSFDLMNGVSAVDVNGNPLEVSFSGEYDAVATGGIASFLTDLERPMKLVQVTFQPTQTGSGTPSPNNKRPIYGVGGVEVNKGGKNLLDPSIIVDQIGWNRGEIQLQPNTTYVASTDYDGTELVFYVKNSYGGYSDSWFVTKSHPVVFTTLDDGLAQFQQRRISGTDSFQNYNWQIEQGTTETEYEPYTEQTISQDFNVSLTPTSKDTDPYLFKAVGDIYGDRLEEELVGGSVVNNQLAKVKANTHNGITTTDDGNGIASLSGTASSTYARTHENIDVIQSHKYLLHLDILANPNSVAFSFGGYNLNSNFILTTNGQTKIVEWSSAGKTTGVGIASVASSTNVAGIKIRFMFIDLTAYFGSATIADAIYNMEQATAGSGIAWLKANGFFTNSYYAYSAPTIKSVEATKHITTGKNLLSTSASVSWTPTLTKNADGSWNVLGTRTSNGAIAIGATELPKGSYVMGRGGTNNNLYFQCLVDGTIVASTQNGDATFTLADVSTVTVRLFARGNVAIERTVYPQIEFAQTPTAYEPYEEHTYSLGDVVLRGIPKLVNNELVYDGDIYKHDGAVTRKYAVVDLGTLNWTANGGSGGIYEYAVTLTGKAYGITNMICEPPLIVENDNTSVNKIRGRSASAIISATSSITTASAFKTAMSGVYLVYELATPTTEQTDQFTEIQEVSKYGTLKYITSNDVPVGHNTTYMTRDVFGGTLDLVSGRLVVTHKSIDLGTVTFGKSGSVTGGFTGTLTDRYPNVNNNPMLCSTYDFDGFGNSNRGYYGADNTIRYYYSGAPITNCEIYIRDTSKASLNATQFKEALNGEQLLIPLETPLTYQLTPQQINTLVGVNNVWSEQGDIKVIFTKSLDTDNPTFDVGGIYDVIYTAVDKCGNKAKVTRQIQVGTFRTVLYADGTFIINEPSDKIEENTRIHGTAQYVYDPLDADHDYVFDVTFNEQTYVYEADTPWADHASDVTRIEICTKISPTDTSGWFLGMTNAQYADVSNLDASQTKAMMAMFYGCESLTSLDLSTFDTSKVENASLMLSGCSSLKDLDVSGWNLANMEHAWWDWYSGASSYIRNVETINLSNVDTSGMTSTANMFDSMEKVTSLDLSSFDTSNVEDMSFMFSGCGTITEIDVSMLNTHKVTSMYGMFQSCLALTDINMSAYEIEPDVFVQRFVTTNVEDMQRMFSGCQSLEHLYLCAFDTSKVEDMSMMFYVCTALQRVYVNADTWTMESLLYSYDMFYQCTNIIGQNGTQFDANHIDAEYAVIDTEQTPGYLWECDR